MTTAMATNMMPGTPPNLRLAGDKDDAGAGVAGTAPGYIASPARLDSLRERRRVRRMLRDIHEGKWRRVLIDLQVSQYAWPKLQQHGGKIAELLTKVNLVRLAWTMHADVLVGTMPTISVPDGFEQHREMLIAIERDNALGALLHSTARKVNVEAEAAVRVDMVDGSLVLRLDDNDRSLPVGPDGPDNQPTVWERRWVVERANAANPKKPKLYLRIERHRAIDGRGVIEQEAYVTETADVLVNLEDLRRVELLVVGVELPDLIETGASRPLLTRFVQDYYDGEPQFAIQESDLDLLDTVTAAMSGLARTHAIHARPKVRISEEMIDKRTGEVDLTADAIVDPEKQFEYITVDAKLTEMLNFMDRMTTHLLVVLQMSPALLGTKMGGGATPDSYAKLRLESTNTLSYAKRGAVHFGPAVSRSLTTASEVDTAQPLRGYALGPVTVKMRPELPKDQADLAEELAALRRDGLIDHRTAIARLHGEEAADQMMVAIEEDQAREAQHQQSALFGAVGGTP